MKEKICLHCLYYPMCKEIAAGNCTAASEACSNFAAAQRWIPVTERVPEDGRDVLVAFDDGFITVFRRVSGEWEYCPGFGKATHWMPLPEEPKEDADA